MGWLIPVKTDSTHIWVGMSQSFLANVREDLRISLACPVSCKASAKLPRMVKYCETSWRFPRWLCVICKPVASRILHQSCYFGIRREWMRNTHMHVCTDKFKPLSKLVNAELQTCDLPYILILLNFKRQLRWTKAPQSFTIQILWILERHRSCFIICVYTHKWKMTATN